MLKLTALALLLLSFAALGSASMISIAAVPGTLTESTTASCPAGATVSNTALSASCSGFFAQAFATFDPATLTSYAAAGVAGAQSTSANTTFSEQLVVTGGSGPSFLTLGAVFTNATNIPGFAGGATVNGVTTGNSTLFPYSFPDGGSALVPFTFGTPFALTVSLNAYSFPNSSADLNIVPLDVYSTVPRAVSVLNSIVNSPCDSSASPMGVTGNILPAPTPEPATNSLFLAGALSLCFCLVRAHRRSEQDNHARVTRPFSLNLLYRQALTPTPCSNPSASSLP